MCKKETKGTCMRKDENSCVHTDVYTRLPSCSAPMVGTNPTVVLGSSDRRISLMPCIVRCTTSDPPLRSITDAAAAAVDAMVVYVTLLFDYCCFEERL